MFRNIRVNSRPRYYTFSRLAYRTCGKKTQIYLTTLISIGGCSLGAGTTVGGRPGPGGGAKLGGGRMAGIPAHRYITCR